MKVSVITSTACLSAGEALRLVDQKDVIKADFVLVSGDIVANADLKGLVQEHKTRRQQDKSAIMTMVGHKSAHAHGACVRLCSFAVLVVLKASVCSACLQSPHSIEWHD